MAKAVASDQIMESSKIKPLLTLSKREPVQAAIALTADGDAVLLLDKKAKPRKVMAMLKAGAGKAKLNLNGASLRFGRAEVDPDYDPAMVRLFVNKEAPGIMRVKLIEVVKRCAFQKVEINIDPALDEEEEGEGEDAAETTTTAAPPPPPPPLDEHHLKSTLSGLLSGAIAGADGARKATLLKVATIANEQLKAGKLDEAAATIEKLRSAIGPEASHPATPQPATPQPATPQPTAQQGAKWQQARTAWQDASDTVDKQIEALAQAMRATGDEELHEIAEFGLNALTKNHKVPLMAALMEIGPGTPDTLAKAGPKALKAIQAFTQHIDTDERVAACDENPAGVAVSIRGTLGPALAQLEAALTPA